MIINLQSTYTSIWNYFFHNTYSLKRMILQHLVLPWIVFDIIAFSWFMLGLQANSGGAFTVLIYIFIPLIFLYLTIVNIGLCIKSVHIKKQWRKIVSLIIFGLCTILSFLGFCLFIGLSFIK